VIVVELNELLYELKKKEEFELKVDVTPEIKLPAGLNKELIYEISAAKNEPAWMTEHRIKSFEIFENGTNQIGALSEMNWICRKSYHM